MVVPDFGDVPNAFKARVAPATAAGSKTTIADEDPGGPNEVKFVFAVASRAEIKAVRNNAECYHDQEGYWWRPYRPDDEKSVGMVAQEVSSQEQIRYRELRLSKGIANELKNAHKRKQIVIIFVDAWTLQLETYRVRVNQCDTVSLLNCAVLIPWNEKDIETCQQEVKLEATLKVTLPTKVMSAGPPYFHARVRSAKDLREGLRKTLVEIKMNLLSLGEVEKAIAGSPLPVPTLPVPGGEGR